MRGIERSCGALLGGKKGRGSRRMAYALYVALGLITVRIVFRFVEFSAGPGDDNPVPHKEDYFYALEAMLVFVVLHPGKVLVGPDADMPGVFQPVKGIFRRGEEHDGDRRGKMVKLENLELSGSDGKTRCDPQMPVGPRELP